MTQFSLPAPLADDLRDVERLILERTHSRAAVISVSNARLLEPEAPRDRAALVLLAALTGDYRRERVLHAAAAVELIAAASATHGGLVDEAERREGVPRVGEWAQGVPLMVGDYLFALAAGEMALAPDARVIDFYSQAVMRISESALAPPPPLRPLEPARAGHLERLAGQAALVAAACKAGGACAGATPEQIEALGRFGAELGLAMALADELRPFADGAPSGLQPGVVTLPLILAAHQGDGERLGAALGGEDGAELAWAAAEVARYGTAPAADELAQLAARATVALTTLPPSEGRDALAQAAAVVARPSGAGGESFPPQVG